MIGKPLLFFVLLPLLAGMAVRSFAAAVASQFYPWVKKATNMSTLVMNVAIEVAYGEGFISAIGSYAIATQILFVGVVTPATYGLGFGLKEE